MVSTQANTRGRGSKRTDNPESKYTMQELASLLGITSAEVVVRVERLSRRTFTTENGNTRKPTLWASKGNLLNETAGRRLLRQPRDNFHAIPSLVRPVNTLCRKQVHACGLGDSRLFELVRAERVETYLYKGRYMFNADDIEAVTQFLPREAPKDMVPLHCVNHARGCSKQAIYQWADRNPGNQGIYREGDRIAAVRHVAINAVYAYLARAFGSSVYALERIKQLGMRYYRLIQPARPRIKLNFQKPRTRMQTREPSQTAPDYERYPQVFCPKNGHDPILTA